MRDEIAVFFIILGTLVLTLGVVGLLRAPSVYTRLHAAGKAVSLGVVSFCMAGFAVGNTEARMRVVLIAIFLLLTTPVASHVIAQAAHRTGED